MNTKTWIIFGVVCVALFGGLIAISKKDQVKVDTSSVNANSIIAATAQSGNIADHVDGNAKSKVIMVEYGDFQCPYCGEAYPGVNQTVKDYSDKIAFVFRNFPLTTLHPNALSAATAAEAAGLQNKYWEMYNLLYQKQSEWSDLSATQRTDQFVSYAASIGGIDATKFKADISSSADIKTKLAFDLSLGTKVGVTGTPSIYINGTKISDDTYAKLIKNDTSSLKAELDKALN